MSQKKSTLRAHAPRAAVLTEINKILKKVPIYELGLSNTSVLGFLSGDRVYIALLVCYICCGVSHISWHTMHCPLLG